MRNRKSERPVLYALQDGADFYYYYDSQLTQRGQTWRAPFRVRDFDMPAAIRAREAFVAQCEFAGWRVEFPNPFGESA